MTERLPRPDLRRPLHLLAFGFGSGLVPVAPGTAGTLVGVLLYLPLQGLPQVGYLAVVLALSALGIPLCDRVSRELGTHDHPGIVWDEIVGFLLTMMLAPTGALWVIAGFLLFRLFDILKPWPIRWLDRRVGGGLGIMLDDLVAGLFASLLLQLAAIWLAG